MFEIEYDKNPSTLSCTECRWIGSEACPKQPRFFGRGEYNNFKNNWRKINDICHRYVMTDAAKEQFIMKKLEQDI